MTEQTRLERARWWIGALCGIATLLSTGERGAWAYPLDAVEETGILRLEAYRRAQNAFHMFPPGADLTSEQVRLRLADRPGFRIPRPDAELSRRLSALLGADGRGYGIAVLDLTVPDRPRLAAHNIDQRFNPGSVGKILVGLGLFQKLADAFPDVAARRKVLKETQVVADRIIHQDDHEIPLWRHGESRVTRRAIEEGDTSSLWTLLDYMFSNSSNAAASLVLREAMLLARLGSSYPPTDASRTSYSFGSGERRRQADLKAALHAPVARSGLDSGSLRQSGFFTREGKKLAPARGSWASPRALLEYLVALEKGDLVDRFSSLELKRLLYLTDRRIRYASSPALDSSAVFFKSGSLYKCRPERGFSCEKYHGNVWNFMNSVAVVESVGRKPALHYLVVVMSNVLRRNSAELHRDLGGDIHRLVSASYPAVPTPRPSPSPTAISEEAERSRSTVRGRGAPSRKRRYRTRR